MTNGDASASTPARDISALQVWIVCALLYAALITLAVINPLFLNGAGAITEWGALEQAQNLILLIALLLAIETFFRADTGGLKGWLAIVAIGTLYLLGEEASWGQHYFGWATTGVFA